MEVLNIRSVFSNCLYDTYHDFSILDTVFTVKIAVKRDTREKNNLIQKRFEQKLVSIQLTTICKSKY